MLTCARASLYAFTTIGYRFYLVFVVVGTVSLIAFVLLAKETKNKSLEEIAQIFGDTLATDTLEDMILAERAETSTEERAEDRSQEMIENA